MEGMNARFLFFCYALLSFSIVCSHSPDPGLISTGQVLKDGEIVISRGGRFALGFFSPGNPETRYVGIWFQGIPDQAVVWVANKDRPIQGRGGTLTLERSGSLEIKNGKKQLLWSSGSSSATPNSFAVLNDSGNLQILNGSDKLIWQSFSHPGDTRLFGMQAHYNISSAPSLVARSWKSDHDPTPGKFSVAIDPRGAPQFVILDTVTRHWRSGHWDGKVFIGVPSMKVGTNFGFKHFIDGVKPYFEYEPINKSLLVYFRIRPDGVEEQKMWRDDLKKWELMQSHPSTPCEIYNRCGAFGICNDEKAPICSCLQGFVPRVLSQWNQGNWSGGCVRRKRLECGKDGFDRIEKVKLPDFVDFIGPDQDDDRKCQDVCFRNCSCIAYAYVKGINCMIWNRIDLVDIQYLEDGENDLFIRLDSSELGSTREVAKAISSKRKATKPILIALVVSGLLFVAVFTLLVRRCKKNVKDIPRSSRIKRTESHFSGPSSSQPRDHQTIEGSGTDIPHFSLRDVITATNNFSDQKLLGHGGFGKVYKGEFPGGQEIAVKRLSGRSGQGIQELKNEISLIARLQHRNLVKLLGYCIEGGEKILLYEYMPNKSLDSFLFDSVQRTLLGWSSRFRIIEGIARGLLYLHRDSRLRIVHRDLKPSNVLLDNEMNPKISDFGMARIFGGNESEANTVKVVGTYGYMSPEYAMGGHFSVKSDVYSFGILILEIISGRKNSEFRSDSHSNVVGHAWELWDKGIAMELADSSIAHFTSSESGMILRCIHIGMLCVQDSVADRPSMASVVLMLESENPSLPLPKEPEMTILSRHVDRDGWKRVPEDGDLTNSVTLSTLDGR